MPWNSEGWRERGGARQEAARARGLRLRRQARARIGAQGLLPPEVPTTAGRGRHERAGAALPGHTHGTAPTPRPPQTHPPHRGLQHDAAAEAAADAVQRQVRPEAHGRIWAGDDVTQLEQVRHEVVKGLHVTKQPAAAASALVVDA
jgi:hypothetical protein